jgi:integrase
LKRGRAFESEDARRKFAADWLAQREKYGTQARFVGAKEVAIWTEFRELVGEVHPVTVAREWLAMKGASNAVTVRDAVTKYLAFRGGENISPDTWRHFEKHLEQRFAEYFGDRRLRDVTDEEISKWLAGLKNPRTNEPMESVTLRHHRKDVNTFMDWCVRVKRWIPHNPCDGVPVPAIVEEDVKLLTVEEGRRLFAAIAAKPIAPRMALEAFGFLRPSSAGRIRKEDIDYEKRGLRLRGAVHKSGKTRFRQGHPDNLWAWLAGANDATWAMEWWQYRNEKSLAFRLAEIEEGSQNRLKKTCISAHLAWLKNPALTARLSQHRYASTTEIYEGVMSEKDGEAWFGILPPASA